MNRVKDIAENTPMIIVEGFKSVWKLYELGIKNVVACMGSGLTMGQANLLYTYAHKGVVLFYDGDTAGVLALEHSINLLKGKLPIYAEVITEIDSKGKGLDPADLTDEQIFYYLNNYIEEE
jgi:DNA primase